MSINETQANELGAVNCEGIILSSSKNLSMDFDAKDDEKYNTEAENMDMDQVSGVSNIVSHISKVSQVDEEALLKQNSYKGKAAIALLALVFIITGIAVMSQSEDKALTGELAKTAIPMLPSNASEIPVATETMPSDEISSPAQDSTTIAKE